MSADENRAAAIKLLTGIKDMNESLITDDFEFWSPILGTVQKDKLKTAVVEMAGAMVALPLFTVVGSTAEGDRVALECTGTGELKNGRRYDNTYHFLFEFRGNRVRRMKEYVDTKRAHDTFSP